MMLKAFEKLVLAVGLVWFLGVVAAFVLTVVPNKAFGVDGGRCDTTDFDTTYGSCVYLGDDKDADGTFPATPYQLTATPQRWAIELGRNVACTAGTATCFTYTELSGSPTHTLGVLDLTGAGVTLLYGGPNDAPLLRYNQCTIASEAACTDITILLHHK